MARGWKCPRCQTQNGEGIMNCSKCGLIQGGEPTAGPESEGSAEGAAESAAAASGSVGFAALPASPTAVQPTTGWVPPYPVAPAAGRPLWRRIPLGLLIFGVLVVGGAVAGFVTNASRSSTGDITRGGDMSSNDLRVGDCWDMKDPSADTIDNVTARPCTEGHEYEVFFIGSMDGVNYPSDAQFSTYVENNCVPAFTTFVGQTYDQSDLDITWLNPLSKGWTLGDRTVECSVYDPNNNQLTASMKGTGR